MAGACGVALEGARGKTPPRLPPPPPGRQETGVSGVSLRPSLRRGGGLEGTVPPPHQARHEPHQGGSQGEPGEHLPGAAHRHPRHEVTAS